MFKSTCAALALSFGLAAPVLAEIPNDADTLAIGAYRDNRTFDRAQLTGSHWMNYWQPVFDTLLKAKDDGSIEPNLAESYSYSEDGTELTLKLHAGVKFTDGTPLTADAVKANMEYLQNSAGQNKWMLAGVDKITVVSDTELVLHLAQPNPALLFGLATVGGVVALPSTLGTPEGAAHPVGSGPYIFDTKDTVTGRQYVYTRNPDYWNKDAYPFDRVSITPITELSARLNALRSGQIDAAVGEPRVVNEAKAAGLTVTSLPADFFGFFIADRDGKMVPALGNVKVRQAINMAMDKAQILKFVDGGMGKVTDQAVAAPNALYDPALEGTYKYDVDAAKALMKEAGYGDGFTVQMPDLASMSAYNPIVEQQLGAIGIKVDWVKVSPTSTIPELLSGKFPLFLFRLGGNSPWGDVVKYIAPTAPWNTAKTETPELDALLADAQKVLPGQDDAKYRAITDYLVKNAWFAPWYQIDSVYLTNKSVSVSLPVENITPYLYDYKKTGK
ncbi:hypothetical protein KM176_00430 [Pseudooceanicola sp. CBS1P-1]|uniref:Peptide ABC transporter substrate-binding protein n=1 Tax=Pseudooceanicola albus TaxID=2692189 RepID=A0A6L7FXN2_9RHOB|nr:MULTISPECIES: ABC transporter substrate-binding protein [Pseudooceanicola]MBT9382312.1 hypothetical protein [Pseudooceanicola endophyticus]MXN16854.1 peptide ABC transporter substrate-binding protein [Pseudooceanicola albus]